MVNPNDVSGEEYSYDKNSEDKKKKDITSRGVPSKFSFYLPPHYSKEVRTFQSDEETPTRNLWNVEEVLNFLFPKAFQPKYHSIAVLFINFLAERFSITGEEIARFVKQNDISKATFYNRVLPKLKRSGMVKVERIAVEKGSSKRSKMKISLSKTFGNYLNKIGDSWLAFVDDIRTRKR